MQTIQHDLNIKSRIGLPFPVLLKSKIPRRRKVGLLVLFALGIFVTIIQIIRIQTISSLSNYVDSAHAILWSIIESNMGITITCIPTLAPLVKYFSEKTRTGTGSTPKKPESRYALHTWGNGMRGLGNRGDNEIDITGIPKGESTDRILDTDARGIMKRTDVAVTRHTIHESDSRESGETMGDEQLGVSQPGSSSTGI